VSFFVSEQFANGSRYSISKERVHSVNIEWLDKVDKMGMTLSLVLNLGASLISLSPDLIFPALPQLRRQ